MGGCPVALAASLTGRGFFMPLRDLCEIRPPARKGMCASSCTGRFGERLWKLLLPATVFL
jgi:hypothetical protein